MHSAASIDQYNFTVREVVIPVQTVVNPYGVVFDVINFQKSRYISISVFDTDRLSVLSMLPRNGAYLRLCILVGSLWLRIALVCLLLL